MNADAISRHSREMEKMLKAAAAAFPSCDHLPLLLLRQVSEGIAVADREGKVLFANPAFAALHGYPPAEVVGKPLSSFHAVEGREPATTGTLAAGKAGEFSAEVIHRRRDGSRFPAWSLCLPIRNDHGEQLGMVLTIRDLSHLSQVRDQMEACEKRFIDIAANAMEWIWETNAEGRYTYASPVVEKVLGYKPGEVVGRIFSEFFNPEDRERLEKEALKIFACRGAFRNFINRNIHKDGSVVWLSTSGVPVLDGKGKLLGYRGADIDITGLKRVEDALRAENQLTQDMLDSMADTVVIFEPASGKLIRFNRAIKNITGYTVDEIYRLKNPQDWHPPEEQERGFAATEKVFKEGWTIVELSLITKAGRRIPYEYHGTLFRDPNGRAKYIIAVGRDITERKKVEAELLKYREHLEELVGKRTAKIQKLNRKCLDEIEERKKIEKDLKESQTDLRSQKKMLEDKNIALRELLYQIDSEKKRIQDDILANIDNLVLPVLSKLKTEGGRIEGKYLNVLENSLQKLASAFGRKISQTKIKLSTRELEICDLIKGGLPTKEIAALLRLSIKTVEGHREMIRRKFKIRNKKVNLSSFLQGL